MNEIFKESMEEILEIVNDKLVYNNSHAKALKAKHEFLKGKLTLKEQDQYGELETKEMLIQNEHFFREGIKFAMELMK